MGRGLKRQDSVTIPYPLAAGRWWYVFGHGEWNDNFVDLADIICEWTLASRKKKLPPCKRARVHSLFSPSCPSYLAYE